MIDRADLPTRRVEAWKYSDLRAAVGDRALPPERGQGGTIIDRLALSQGHHVERVLAAGEAEIVVEHLGGEGLEAHANVFNVGRHAALTRVVIQSGGEIALNVAHVTLAEGARFRQFVLAQGAKLARVETHVRVEGADAHVELNGVYMCAAARHADLTSVIEHAATGGETRQLIKGVARKGGRGVFQGKIVVAHGAQQTDARQYHHGLLLEDGAEIFAKPELMIHADDVQCAHGNTAGGLDESALFYLRSRGVPEAEARGLLIEAFLAAAIPNDLPEDIREDLAGRIQAWLRGAP